MVGARRCPAGAVQAQLGEHRLPCRCGSCGDDARAALQAIVHGAHQLVGGSHQKRTELSPGPSPPMTQRRRISVTRQAATLRSASTPCRVEDQHSPLFPARSLCCAASFHRRAHGGTKVDVTVAAQGCNCGNRRGCGGARCRRRLALDPSGGEGTPRRSHNLSGGAREFTDWHADPEAQPDSNGHHQADINSDGDTFGVRGPHCSTHV